MSKNFLAAIAGCLMCATSSFAQYQQPYQPQQSAYPYASPQQAWNGVSAPSPTPAVYRQPQQAWGQPQQGPVTSWSSARFRQGPDDIAIQPRDPAPQSVAGTPQTSPAYSQVPTLVAPTCGADYSCDGGHGHGGYAGQAYGNGTYFDAGDDCGCGSPRRRVGRNYFEGRQACGGQACDLGDSCGCCNDRYLKLFGGWNWLNDTTDDRVGTNSPFAGSALEWNEGWVVGGAFGKRLSQNLSAELEVAYRNNTPDAMAGLPGVDVSGHINAYSLMGNLVYELGQVAGLQPYIGGGIGLGFIEGDLTIGGFPFDVDDSSFAYQGIVGVSRQLSARAKLFGEYRYFAATDVDVDMGGFGSFTTDYEANNFIVGLQFTR